MAWMCGLKVQIGVQPPALHSGFSELEALEAALDPQIKKNKAANFSANLSLGVSDV